MRVAVILFVSTAVVAASSGAGEAADPDLGEVLFRTHCATCHAIDLPRTVFGPHLVGVFGRKAGSVEGFRYSYELRVSGIVWDEETLDALMIDPQALVPGTIMYYRGLHNEDHRAHIIAYLKQQSAAK